MLDEIGRAVNGKGLGAKIWPGLSQRVIERVTRVDALLPEVTGPMTGSAKPGIVLRGIPEIRCAQVSRPFKMKWNVIWQVDPDNLSSCVERDWFYEIMSLVPINAVQVDYNSMPLLKLVQPNSIICVSCPNQTSQSDLIQYLKRMPKPRILYHMSDEFVEVGRDLYQNCELVIRNGSANFELLNEQTVIQLPLGYVTGLRNNSRVCPTPSQRMYSFAFLGTIKHERKSEMLPALRAIPGPHFVAETESFAAALTHFGNSTSAIYKNAVFVPNPKGNWNPECFRMYDALEWGCIPLIKKYADTAYHENYHDKLLGNHPIPKFDDWNEAAQFATELLAEEDSLAALQTQVLAWWQDYKTELQLRVASKLAAYAR